MFRINKALGKDKSIRILRDPYCQRNLRTQSWKGSCPIKKKKQAYE